MKTKISLIASLMLIMSIYVKAQAPELRPLKIGEKIPDVELTLQTGDSISHCKISDLHKAILFDTWTTHCGVCIASLPHMLELQEKYKNELTIIMVTPNTYEEVKKWRIRENGHLSPKIFEAQKHLTFLYGRGDSNDTIPAVNGLFIHHGNPVDIWISKDGVYEARTWGDFRMNTDTIEAFLKGEINGRDDQIVVKNPFDFLDQNVEAHLKSYSIITGGINGEIDDENHNAILTDSASGKVVGVKAINESPLDLYRWFPYKNCLQEETYPCINNDRILIEMKDPKRFTGPIDDNEKLELWYLKNFYCYAVKVPVEQSGELNEIMAHDLDRFFHVESGIETRKVKCWILKRTGSYDRLKARDTTKGGYTSGYNANSNEYIIHNGSISDLSDYLRRAVQNLYTDFAPFVDETNYRGKIDASFPNIYKQYRGDEVNYTISELRHLLNKYGLDLVQEYRERKMLVIRDKDYHEKIHASKSNLTL